MNIVHIGLAAYYTEGMTYQDNLLSEFNARDGHTTTYISNAQCWENGKIVDVDPCNRILGNGVRLIRMRYRALGLRLLTEKTRVVSGLYKLLVSLQPDVILSHDLCYWSVLDVIRYKKEHPEVTLYADTHTDANNSGTNWLSLHVLHRIFYKYLIQQALPHVKKYLYVSKECRDFSTTNYAAPSEQTEFFPLGGTILSLHVYQQLRSQRRSELGVSENDILFVHSGKFDKLKRTPELLRAFSSVDNPSFRLVLIGTLLDDISKEVETLISTDSRIQFLGWKTGTELQSYLCACDMYLQPGSQSATMQNATCCGAPSMLYRHPSYSQFDNGHIFFISTVEEMAKVFLDISENPQQLNAMRKKAIEFAAQTLDYAKLASKLYIK